MDLSELAMLLQTMDSQPVSMDRFKEASVRLKAGSIRLEQDQQLLMYALFKQVTEGDAPEAMPESADPTAPYKYEAWKTVRGFPRDGAARVYVHLVDELSNGSDNGSAGQGDASKEGAQGFGSVFSTLM
jgi:diazepam-binding inhibitor (GABA receptor modulator, acyl-CoA-binding protein)